MNRLITVALVLLCCSAARAESLDALLTAARAEGLPVEYVQSKVREGRAKKVPEVIIRQVAAKLLGHMRSAQKWLKKGEIPAPAILVAAVAEARLAGISRKILQMVVQPGAGSRGVLIVDTLADLHLRGYSPQEAAALIQATTPTELAAVGQVLDQLRRSSSASRSEALDLLLWEVKRNKGSLNKAAKNLRKRGGPKGASAKPIKPKKPQKPKKPKK